jgi:ABC-type Fe3+-hydroxamate transport system substrate-binding protein
MNDVIEKAGGINIFYNINEAYPTTGSEVIIINNPDVILLPTNMGGITSYGSVSDVKARPGWNTINAVKMTVFTSLMKRCFLSRALE